MHYCIAFHSPALSLTPYSWLLRLLLHSRMEGYLSHVPTPPPFHAVLITNIFGRSREPNGRRVGQYIILSSFVSGVLCAVIRHDSYSSVSLGSGVRFDAMGVIRLPPLLLTIPECRNEMSDRGFSLSSFAAVHWFPLPPSFQFRSPTPLPPPSIHSDKVLTVRFSFPHPPAYC